MKIAFYIFALAFLISTVFVAPFIKDKKSTDDISDMTTQNGKLQTQLDDKSSGDMREILCQSFPRSRKKLWEVFLTTLLVVFSGNGWLVACVMMGALLSIIIYDFLIVKSELKKSIADIVQNFASDLRFNILAIFGFLALIIIIPIFGCEAYKFQLAEKKSPVPQVNQSSNVAMNNNSGNTTASGSNATLNYQNGSNNQISSPNFSGSIQGQMNLPVNNGTVIINNPIYTNPPDRELRALVAQINDTATFASNGVFITKAQLLQLSILLTKLDERTEDIQELPDGRTSVGGIRIRRVCGCSGLEMLNPIKRFKLEAWWVEHPIAPRGFADYCGQIWR